MCASISSPYFPLSDSGLGEALALCDLNKGSVSSTLDISLPPLMETVSVTSFVLPEPARFLENLPGLSFLLEDFPPLTSPISSLLEVNISSSPLQDSSFSPSGVKFQLDNFSLSEDHPHVLPFSTIRNPNVTLHKGRKTGKPKLVGDLGKPEYLNGRWKNPRVSSLFYLGLPRLSKEVRDHDGQALRDATTPGMVTS